MKTEREVVGKKKEEQGDKRSSRKINIINIHKENGSLGLFMGKGKVRNLNRVETRSHQCPFLFTILL